MNTLEKLIYGIQQRHFRKKEEKEERKKVELEKQERVKKIYQAISDFIKKTILISDSIYLTAGNISLILEKQRLL